MKRVAKCPTCQSKSLSRKGLTGTGVQKYQCLSPDCPQPYFRARYYTPKFPSHTAYVADWRRRKARHTKLHHRHQKTEWETAPEIFDPLHAEFGFSLDVCASPDNAKCPSYFTKQDDGLRQDWGQEICFMNPPYGASTMPKWMNIAYESSLQGALVVCLVPARYGTKWWRDYVKPLDQARDVRDLPGRQRFLEQQDGVKVPARWTAGFYSIVVIFRPPTPAGD